MKNINFQELNDFYDDFCEVSGVKNAQRNNRIKHFNLFIAECKFKPTDSIERLVEKEIYLLESHKGTANKRYVKEFVNRDFIEFLKKQKINTLPLLPSFIYVKDTKNKSFKFGRRQQKALGNFVLEMNAGIDLHLHKLIILNIFYGIGYVQIARDIKPTSITTEMVPGGRKMRIFIKHKSPTREIKTPITDFAKEVLLEGCEEDELLCNKSLSPFMQKIFPSIVKEYGFLGTQDFRDTIVQKVINLVGAERANGILGLSTIKHTKARYAENLEEGREFLIEQYIAINPLIST
jgi:hypothetical protein